MGQSEVLRLMSELGGSQKLFTSKEISICLDQGERSVRRNISCLVSEGVLERVVMNNGTRGASIYYRLTSKYSNIVGGVVERFINLLRI